MPWRPTYLKYGVGALKTGSTVVLGMSNRSLDTCGQMGQGHGVYANELCRCVQYLANMTEAILHRASENCDFFRDSSYRQLASSTIVNCVLTAAT